MLSVGKLSGIRPYGKMNYSLSTQFTGIKNFKRQTNNFITTVKVMRQLSSHMPNNEKEKDDKLLAPAGVKRLIKKNFSLL